MKLFKLSAVAAAAGLALSASAMTSIQDEELAQVVGQAGVSIIANLNIKNATWTYTDTDTDGGNVTFGNIIITGMLPLTIDIMTAAAFTTETITTVAGLTGSAAGATALVTNAGVALSLNGSDVVKFAVPSFTDPFAGALAPSIGAGFMKMGNSTTSASYGSQTLGHLDARGTKLYMWAH